MIYDQWVEGKGLPPGKTVRALDRSHVPEDAALYHRLHREGILDQIPKTATSTQRHHEIQRLRIL